MNMTITPNRNQWGWPENLASLYICAPVILFILTWFHPLLAVCSALPFLYILLREILTDCSQLRFTAAGAKTLAVCLLIALLWMLLSGISGFFYANHDWAIRYPLARDLTSYPWPVEYQSKDETYTLRSSLGLFIIPCALAKLIGINFLTKLLTIWSWLGVSLTLFIAFMGMKWQQALLAALIFALGSGLDYIGSSIFRPNSLYYGSHIEWWLTGLQYSSNTTLLFWVPNHTLAAWLATTMLFRHRDSDSLLPRMVPIVPSLMLWSPLSGGGFALLLLASKPELFRLATLRSLLPRALSCTPTALLLLVYVAEGAASISSQSPPPTYSPLTIVMRASLFFLIEVGVFIAYVVSKGGWKPLLPALIILVLLPYFNFGVNNDLVMRASIPALAYLWLWLATAASDTRSLCIKPWKAVLFYAPFLIGAITPLHEIERAISVQAWEPDFSLNLPISFLADGSPEAFPAHYFAKTTHSSLSPLLAPPSRVERVEYRIVHKEQAK